MTEMVKTKVNGEFTIVLPKHRADRPEWYTDMGWEKKRLKHMSKHIGKGDTVFYVGSEEGEFPALLQMWGAEVILFEPNPKVWSNTKAIWEANDLDEPVTFQGFCSEEDRIVDIHGVLQHGFPRCADDVIEAAHGFKELNKEASNYNQIRIDSIKAHTPTVICLDVEGSEGHVLRGAWDTLVKHRPKIYLSLHPEFIHEQYGEEGAALRAWLMQLGYKETLIDYPLHEVHLYYEAKK